MDEEINMPSYRGSKDFSQQDVYTANATGFGAAADDYMERGIDLNEQLILNKPATFFMRMKGDAMTDAGIHDGDVLIVDRSIHAQNGNIIIAAVDGDLTVRRLQQKGAKKMLVAADSQYKDIEINESAPANIWGVVTCVIHLLEPHLFKHVLKPEKKDSGKKKRG